MSKLSLIPELTVQMTLTEAIIEGTSFDPMDEVPAKFQVSYVIPFGADPAKAQARVFGNVIITREQIEAENNGRAYAQTGTQALARAMKKLVRNAIKAQIQDLFKKEPTP